LKHLAYISFVTLLLGYSVISIGSCKSDENPSPKVYVNKSVPAQVEVKAPLESLQKADRVKTDSVSAATPKAQIKDASMVENTGLEKNKEQLNTPEKKESKTQLKTKKLTAPKLRPSITFEKIRYDFGEIMQGDTVDYNFVFTNTGKTPLVVKSTKVTCGCTQPSYPFIPIESGEEGYIGVKYISVGKEGSQKPLITVYTNASKEPVTLMLSGTVKVPKKEEKSVPMITPDSTKSTEEKLDTLSKSN